MRGTVTVGMTGDTLPSNVKFSGNTYYVENINGVYWQYMNSMTSIRINSKRGGAKEAPRTLLPSVCSILSAVRRSRRLVRDLCERGDVLVRRWTQSGCGGRQRGVHR